MRWPPSMRHYRPHGRASPPKAMIAREHDGLSPIPHSQFVVDVRDVIAHRLLADGETLADLCVGEAFADQREHLAFARGERGERVARDGGSGAGEVENGLL